MRGTPPALAGGPEAIGLDQVIRRALARRPGDRFAGAMEMASALRETAHPGIARSTGFLRATARLLIHPFRVLRHDPETDFLAESIPDALVVSLSKVESLIVRSGHEQPDGADASANVDLMLRGTMVRAGDEIRITTQLVDFRSGDVARSSESRGVVRDLFDLQDRICQEILTGLALAPSPTEKLSMRKEEPKNPRAYELYLRANRLAQSRRLWAAARDLYLECLREDPTYAPAWARLGRMYRVIAKYGHTEDPARQVQLAEQAFQTALNLDPDSSLAHNLYTYFEIEQRGAAGDAMIRLLERARAHPTDAEIFSGLVVACRFCGLLDASVAAHERGRQIDPGLSTSVHYTFWMMGEFEKAIAHDDDELRFMTNYSLPLLGRSEEAIRGLTETVQSLGPGLLNDMLTSTRHALEGNREACLRESRKLLDSSFRDPEGLYFCARQFAIIGEPELALSVLADVVSRGFLCVPAFQRDPWLDPIRDSDRFAAIMDMAETEAQIVRERFERAGGPALLGVSALAH
jgi:TolB-like protein